ncbi:hypothetical protein [Cohaesibacter haloalkalitolerans]|uniref:hypothetical protein n=1 Tax=Cohaesibacter haloalkalitolerans TaxID=1162980 RepID=UPI0013C45EC6|nr:hypothetical protein [Cohaesibacter haloalkalitolerans]
MRIHIGQNGQSIVSMAEPDAKSWQLRGRGSRLAAALVLAVCAGSLVYGLRATAPDQYRSEARLLLLAPPQQYVPTATQVTVQGNSAQTPVRQTARADAVLSQLQSGDSLRAIVSKLGLSNDKAYAADSIWQTMVAMVRHRTLNASPTDLAMDRLSDWTEIERIDDRQVISISTVAPEAEQARQIANELAKSYLALLAESRKSDFSQSVKALASEVEALSSQLETAGEETGANVQGQLLQDAAPKADFGHSAMIRAQEAGKRQMLENLRIKEAELKTLASLDLIPPAARMLGRAIASAAPVDRAPAQWALATALLVLGLCLFAPLAGAFLRRKAGKEGELPASETIRMPSEIRMAYPLPVVLPVMPSANVGLPAIRTEEVPYPEESNPVAGLFDCVEAALDDVSHARIVLMAQGANWGAHGMPLAEHLMRQHSVAYLCLDELQADRQAPRGKMNVKDWGVTDFLDGRAGFGDLIDEDWTGLVNVVGAGDRSLETEDFQSPKFLLLLIALEAAYDLVLIDLGANFDNEKAIRSLASANDAWAFIHVPKIDPNDVTLLHDALQMLGFSDSLIITDMMAEEMAQVANQDLLQAAE